MTAAAAGSSLFTGNHIREFFARRLAWHTALRAQYHTQVTRLAHAVNALP